MSITATNQGGNFKQAPTGNHVARCYQIVDLGSQRQTWEGVTSIKHQVLVSWELPNEELLEEGQPMSIAKFYTLSLHEKSNLCIDLVAWRGKKFTAEEEKGFDISKLVGVPCQLSIIEGNNGKSRVAGVSGLLKGVECPPQINPSIVFSLQDYINGDTSIYDKLSDGIKGLVDKCIELAGGQETPSTIDSTDDFEDSDIPF